METVEAVEDPDDPFCAAYCFAWTPLLQDIVLHGLYCKTLQSGLYYLGRIRKTFLQGFLSSLDSLRPYHYPLLGFGDICMDRQIEWKLDEVWLCENLNHFALR